MISSQTNERFSDVDEFIRTSPMCLQVASHVIVYVTPGITPPPLGVVLLDRQSFDAGAVEQALLRQRKVSTADGGLCAVQIASASSEKTAGTRWFGAGSPAGS